MRSALPGRGDRTRPYKLLPLLRYRYLFAVGGYLVEVDLVVLTPPFAHSFLRGIEGDPAWLVRRWGPLTVCVTALMTVSEPLPHTSGPSL
jgi:hypothetical protein